LKDCPAIVFFTDKRIWCDQVRNWTQITSKPGKYPIITFTIDGEAHTELIHRAVCEAFYGPAPNKDQITVDHIDGDPTNYSADNLRWASASEQAVNRKKKILKANSTTKQVHQIDLETGEILNIFFSINEAGRQTGISREGISHVVRKVHKQASGFGWKYANDDIPCEDKSGEVWRPFFDQPKYFASNLGRIKRLLQDDSYHLVHDVELRPLALSRGYFRLGYKLPDNSFVLRCVSRIIWIAFNGAIPDDHVIDHIDEEAGPENKKNNSLHNLQCVTVEKNVQLHFDRKRARKETESTNKRQRV
jgi:hypothetical protein